MPKRKYAGGSSKSNKRSRSRKIYKAKRKAKAKARVTTVVRGPGPVPKRVITKHKYVEEWASDGVTLDRRYNLNSLYSPDYTGGHQPYGRDTYAGLYNRYRVFAVRYRVFYSTTSSATTTYRGCLLWNNDSSAQSNWGLIAERPGSRTTEFSWTRHSVLKGHLTLANITGVTPVQYKTDDRFQAQAGATPSETIALHVFHADNTGNPAAANIVQIRVQLTFYCEWFDPLDLAQS